ncbi:F-type H+-transporting ATPase subunit a [Desulfohalotomaculum tongense]|uniref:F0F1 ATP synthase subunit A n=1 Tax=Desulforadius tongensis TaxID=1216062 RepID=UPI0019572F44|nr:F0F1 ATP synthase subunit A [Desulforadius tongensis]MBM7853736.1 F-type H+-transporting ATPase subunit a [Desulforadius tongensis]
MKSLEQVHEEIGVLWEKILGEAAHGPTHLGTVAGYSIDVNVKTIVMTWIVMAIVALVGVLATRNLSMDKPSRLQVVYESVYEYLKGLIFDNITSDKRAASMVTFIVTLFTFLWFANMLGLVPTMMSPTADVNTTMGLALMVFFTTQFLGLKDKGLGHFKHFVEPFPFFLPLVIVEELAKPVTLAFRLFGNIYAGEVLIAVLLGLIPLSGSLMGGFIPSVIWLAFSIFVGTIQAFIFSMLTIIYTSQAVNKHH